MTTPSKTITINNGVLCIYLSSGTISEKSGNTSVLTSCINEIPHLIIKKRI